MQLTGKVYLHSFCEEDGRWWLHPSKTITAEPRENGSFDIIEILQISPLRKCS